MEILGLKNAISDFKKSLDKLNRIEMTGNNQ